MNPWIHILAASHYLLQKAVVHIQLSLILKHKMSPGKAIITVTTNIP